MTSKKDKIIYRVDGGRVWGISMGHIKRALILAHALKRTNDIVFVMKKYHDGISLVRQAGFAVEEIQTNDDSCQTMIEISKKHMPSKIIFDLRNTSYKDFFSFTKEQSIETIVFDILGNVSGTPDIIINDSFVSAFTSYSFSGKRPAIYAGPKYFLSDELPKPLALKKTVSNIAITMGGSDPAGLTEKIVKSLSTGDSSRNYNVIFGPLFPEDTEKSIRNLRSSHSHFEFYRDPSNFLEILSKQDIVICAAGRTLYECAALGRPTIVVPSIEHELVTAENYSHLTRNVNLGIWDEDTGRKILETIQEYENPELREVVFRLGQHLVDGKAYHRIMQIIN